MKKFGQLHDQLDGQFGTIWSNWSVFSAFSGFGVSIIPNVKHPGKCHDLERKCKMLIQVWAGGILLGF